MKGLLMMLKSMGIEIDPAEIERMRVGIPQLIIDVRQSVKDFDAQLQSIEARLHHIEERLEVIGRNVEWKAGQPVYDHEPRTN